MIFNRPHLPTKTFLLVESTDNFNFAQNSSALFGSQKEINEESLLNNSFTQEALSFINVASTNAGPRGVHISLADIIPLPRAGQRRVSKKERKKGDTRILTNMPVRNSIAEGFAAKKRKKEEVQRKAKNTLIRSGFRRKKSPSSSEESDGSMVFAESDDTNVSNDEELIGDFVIVKLVLAKSRIAHYIARIDAMDKNEFEGVFLLDKIHLYLSLMKMMKHHSRKKTLS